MHTYLFVDGLDLIARSDSGAVGLPPGELLRPGGPLHPTDAVRDVDVAHRGHPGDGAPGLRVRVGLRGGTVVWSGLMCPGPDGGVIEEVRFEPGQYLGEIWRAYRLHA
ncbi:hypothetical protein [Streptomyces sp. NPDC002559]